MRSIFFFLLWLLLGGAVSAQRHYVCYYTPSKPVIDGAGSEKVWEKVPWTEDFVDIEGDIRPRPELRTRAKLLWDSTNLYIYAELQEPDLWARLKQHDTIIFLDNDFEVFLDPDNDTHNYFEVEINALGTVMDLFMGKPYRNGGKALMGWDVQGLRSAVSLAGTMNHPGDKDRGWSVEMAIPLESLRLFSDKLLGDSSVARINFSRVEWDRDVVEGKYVPRVNGETGRRLPEHNWVWSPQGIVDMHAPESWGYLLFTSRVAGRDTMAFVEPVDVPARKYLWDVFYRQRKYRADHGEYAKGLEILGLKDSVTDGKGGNFRLQMEATRLQYMVLINGDRLPRVLSIDQDGKLMSGIGKY